MTQGLAEGKLFFASNWEYDVLHALVIPYLSNGFAVQQPERSDGLSATAG
jgi:hypothetical protein